MIGSYTDKALRETLNELRKAYRLDGEERERQIRIVSEGETAINALGTRMMAALVVIEAFEAEVVKRAGGDIREVRG